MTAENFINQNAVALSKIFDFDLMLEEISIVKELEKSMGFSETPAELFDIAASGDRTALAKYHTRVLNLKIKKINEELDSWSQIQRERFERRVSGFKNQLIELIKPIYEQASALYEQGGLDLSEFGTLNPVSTAKPVKNSSWWSAGWSFIKNLWNTLTEGGSVIGIIQLILDVIGMFGDFVIPGLGMGADVINAVIYFIRGEYFLGILSVIAVLPIGGMIAPIIKPFTKGIGGIVTALFTKKATKEVAKSALEQAGEKGAPTIIKFFKETLPTTARTIAAGIVEFIKIFPTTISWLTRIVTLGFENPVSKWIMKSTKVLEGWQTILLKVGDDSAQVVTELEKLAAKAAKAAKLTPGELQEIVELNSKLLSEGGTVTRKVKAATEGFEAVDEIVYTVGGKPKAIQTNQIVDNASHKFKFEDLPSAKSTTTQGTATKEIDQTEFFKANSTRKVIDVETKLIAYEITKFSASKKLGENIAKYLGRTPKWAFYVGLGKLIWKYLYNLDPTGGVVKSGSGDDAAGIMAIDEADLLYVSNAALSDYVSHVIADRQAKTGEIYNPTVDFNSQEREAYQFVTAYNNNLARNYGQPLTIPVIYNKFSSESPDVKEELGDIIDDIWAKTGGGSAKKKKSNDSNESLSFNEFNLIIKSPFSKFR